MGPKDSFEEDVRKTAEELQDAQRPSGFFAHLLHFLGLWDNSSEIRRRRQAHAQAIADHQELQDYESDRRTMEAFLDHTIVLGGVQVLSDTFLDLTLDGNASYPPDWEELRQSILARDQYRCQEADGDCRGPLQIHHRLPLSKGGGNQEQNLITLCLYHHVLQHPDNPVMVRWLKPGHAY